MELQDVGTYVTRATLFYHIWKDIQIESRKKNMEKNCDVVGRCLASAIYRKCVCAICVIAFKGVVYQFRKWLARCHKRNHGDRFAAGI